MFTAWQRGTPQPKTIRIPATGPMIVPCPIRLKTGTGSHRVATARRQGGHDRPRNAAARGRQSSAASFLAFAASTFPFCRASSAKALSFAPFSASTAVTRRMRSS